MKSKLCHKPTFSRPTARLKGIIVCGVCVRESVCVHVCECRAEATQRARKQRLGVSNVKNRHLVASGAPSISARPGAPFISGLCPGSSGAGREDKSGVI